MKKTAALRQARADVPPPVSHDPRHFIITVPVDVRHPRGDQMQLGASSYHEAQHARAYAVCRVALAYMGLQNVPLVPEDGGTVDQLMSKALKRAARADEDPAAPAYWQVRLGFLDRNG